MPQKKRKKTKRQMLKEIKTYEDLFNLYNEVINK